MLKIKYEYKLLPDDLVSVSFFFSQTFYDVYLGNVLMEESDMRRACAILMLMAGNEETDIRSTFPISFLKEKSEAEIAAVSKLIRSEMVQLPQSLSLKQYKYLYLQTVRKYDTYMSVHVPVAILQDSTQQQHREYCLLVLKPNRLTFVNSTFCKLFHFMLNDIEFWALQGKRVLQLTVRNLQLTELGAAVLNAQPADSKNLPAAQNPPESSQNLLRSPSKTSLLLESDQSDNIIFFIIQSLSFYQKMK